MNSFNSLTTETEQKQREEKETQTVPPAVTPTPAPVINQAEEPLAPGLSVVEPEPSPQLYPSELTFCCILIPRFHDHHLTGDITEYLVEWMRQVCISYAWRLDAIAVRPGYMQWVMTVPLNAKSGSVHADHSPAHI